MSDAPRSIDFPLRLRALARKDAAVAARALSLDRELQIVARKAGTAKSDGERKRLVSDMMELRIQIDALIATTLGQPLPTGAEGSALARVPDHVRAQLAKLLGVPLRTEFYPVLDRKAEEWIEQGRAFDEIAAEFGFEPGDALAPRDPRGALALTYNGSLVQISAPKDDSGTRRFIYQSIYVNSIPSEGTLKLKETITIDGRLRSSAMDTSTVRKLRVATRRGVSWERERRTFDRISTILTPAPSVLQAIPRHTLWGAASGFLPAMGQSAIDAARAAREGTRIDEARRAARVELGAMLEKLASPDKRRATIDVEVLGLCLHLQGLEIERGRTGHELVDVTSVETDRGERLVIGEDIRVVRPGRRDKTFPLTALGEQQLVIGAPLVVLDEEGSVVAILGDVTLITAR